MKPQKLKGPHLRDVRRIQAWARVIIDTKTRARITSDQIGARCERRGATINTILRLASQEGKGVSLVMMRRVSKALREELKSRVDESIKEFNQYIVNVGGLIR
jgi:hypothetical protein